MRYQVLENIRVETNEGVTEVQPGQVILFPQDSAVPWVERGKIRPLMPHIEKCATLVIPSGSDPKYHWWNGGQSIMETLEELGAEEDVLENYKWRLN